MDFSKWFRLKLCFEDFVLNKKNSQMKMQLQKSQEQKNGMAL